ncbi:tigger transposable element-derived protein 1-like [Ailuropoda melanoleuca]|uniref:tigger transposable element-derived protein 1-like n=1 Tax=Ailuropoda melanoleuca TaxID=9646 RepID=UPI001494AB3F|nr:tigger transposable element-derived protein 1-like [Ailuropoda melanoleuca]
MEEVLVIWIEDQIRHDSLSNQNLIQSKALTLFNSMKAKRGEEGSEEEFEGRRSWFMRFRERSCLCNVKVQDEAAGADIEAAARCTEGPAKIMKESDYTEQWVSSVDEIALHSKQMSPSTSIVTEEESMPGFRASKGRLTLLLGANAVGDLKLKPVLIYHSKNLTALKNYAKSTLPVLYKWTDKAWMTAHLFTRWFTEYFKLPFGTYSEKKIPLKILLFIDNALGYPRALVKIYNKINVAFMNANTNSILQPVDQGVILTFKPI